MRLFFATLGFLTRLPVPNGTILSDDEFKKGIVFYPFVGLITGIIMAALFYLLNTDKLGLTAAIITVAAQGVITGGFHLDGLADSFDALFSARKKEQMLEIMKDSRIGAFGVLALIFVILIKISVLVSLTNKMALHAALLYPVAGKTITPLLMHSNYAREKKGLGSIYLSEKYTVHMLIAVVIGFCIIFIGIGYLGAIGLLVASLWAVLFRKYCQKILGGMTGDTLGCGSELCEVVFLLTIFKLC